MPTASSRLERNPAFRRLKSLLQQPGPLTLAQRHEIGQQVEQLCPDRRYGEGTMSGLAEALGRPESFATSLLAMRKFAEVYRRTEVVRLSKPAPSGFQLRWSHFILLLSLPPKQRLKLQRQCMTKEWSARELHQQIKLERGLRPWGGRPPSRPKSIAQGVRQVIDANTSLLRRYRASFGGTSPAISVAARKDRGALTESLLTDALNSLIELEQSVANARKVLQKLRTELKRR